ncbi:hypothetical protein GQF42_11525 [Streptomyces broussonetiae]|uniref:Uncharacterized protein n=1 Tax=Streptomyces broussonetiae TaxID=2686304 RepID=A0A6I6N019_9ACTN|nr:hypothetical protein GQF42_11525 [Streptomyces broussonetiae]
MRVPPRWPLACGGSTGWGLPCRTAGEERCPRPARTHAGDSSAYASPPRGRVADLSHARPNPCGVRHFALS